MDQYFVLTDMPEHKQDPFVSTLLRDEALLRFRSNYETWDPATALTWSILRASMREYFAPPNEDRRLQDEWADLKQYGTVFEYVSVLTALAMRIPGLSQTQILDKFIRGLKPKTRIEVELRDTTTPDEAYHLTDHFDRIVYGARNNNFLTQNYNHYAPATNVNNNADYGEPTQIDILQPHQPGVRNFQRSQSFQQTRNQGLCFTCEKH
jgi:Retrotransposon gag protein